MPSRTNPFTSAAEEEDTPNKVLFWFMQENSKQEEIDRKIQEKAQEEAEQIIEEMEKRYDEDLKLFEKKKPASRKLTYMSTLSERLKHVIWD